MGFIKHLPAPSPALNSTWYLPASLSFVYQCVDRVWLLALSQLLSLEHDIMAG